MAAHWIREVTSTATGTSTGFPFGSKALAMFLRYVCGYTNATEIVARIGVGDSVSIPDGSNKQTLSDSEGEFVALDVGRTITVTNMGDPNNNGVFTITDYTSATQIKYVNAGGSAETSSFDWEITITDSYWTFAKNGVNGSINITGTDKTFQDTTASAFTGGDTGAWLLLKDSTNPENSGWYKVTYVDANNVTLDFRSGAAEYPTQNTGANLSWWLIGDTYEVPTRGYAYWRLRTPHALGWEIEVKYNSADPDQGFQIRISTDADWTVSGSILSTVYVGVDDGDATWFYCVADDAGEYINFFFHNSTNSQYNGFLVSNVLLSEPGRADTERVALMGCSESSPNVWSNYNTYGRYNNNNYSINRGSIWNEAAQVARVVYMIEPSYLSYSDSFTYYASHQVNSRTGNWDFIEGDPIITDYDNDIGEYEIIGILQGIYLTSKIATARAAHDDEGTKDKFHVYEGHAVAWPGYTQQH